MGVQWYDVSTNLQLMAIQVRRLQLLPFESIANSPLLRVTQEMFGFWCVAAAVPHAKFTRSSFSSCITLMSCYIKFTFHE